MEKRQNVETKKCIYAKKKNQNFLGIVPLEPWHL